MRHAYQRKREQSPGRRVSKRNERRGGRIPCQHNRSTQAAIRQPSAQGSSEQADCGSRCQDDAELICAQSVLQQQSGKEGRGNAKRGEQGRVENKKARQRGDGSHPGPTVETPARCHGIVPHRRGWLSGTWFIEPPLCHRGGDTRPPRRIPKDNLTGSKSTDRRGPAHLIAPPCRPRIRCFGPAQSYPLRNPALAPMEDGTNTSGPRGGIPMVVPPSTCSEPPFRPSDQQPFGRTTPFESNRLLFHQV